MEDNPYLLLFISLSIWPVLINLLTYNLLIGLLTNGITAGHARGSGQVKAMC